MLLARAAPFDHAAQAVLCSTWGLPAPVRSAFVGYLDPPAAAAWRRMGGVHRRLSRLTAACPAPAALGVALGLADAMPTASESDLQTALLAAGVCDGTAQPRLLPALAELWQLPAAPCDQPLLSVPRSTRQSRAFVILASWHPRRPRPRTPRCCELHGSSTPAATSSRVATATPCWHGLFDGNWVLSGRWSALNSSPAPGENARICEG